MTEIANLAVPYFGLIFIGFAWDKANGPPEQRARLDEGLPSVCIVTGAALR
jgi:hypothetical protein